jgi:hypothetical protein
LLGIVGQPMYLLIPVIRHPRRNLDIEVSREYAENPFAAL